MTIYSATRTDEVEWDEVNAFVVMAETPKAALELIRHEADGVGVWKIGRVRGRPRVILMSRKYWIGD